MKGLRVIIVFIILLRKTTGLTFNKEEIKKISEIIDLIEFVNTSVSTLGSFRRHSDNKKLYQLIKALSNRNVLSSYQGATVLNESHQVITVDNWSTEAQHELNQLTRKLWQYSPFSKLIILPKSVSIKEAENFFDQIKESTGFYSAFTFNNEFIVKACQTLKNTQQTVFHDVVQVLPGARLKIYYNFQVTC